MGFRDEGFGIRGFRDEGLGISAPGKVVQASVTAP